MNLHNKYGKLIFRRIDEIKDLEPRLLPSSKEIITFPYNYEICHDRKYLKTIRQSLSGRNFEGNCFRF